MEEYENKYSELSLEMHDRVKQAECKVLKLIGYHY